jgi:hypothetical protein
MHTAIPAAQSIWEFIYFVKFMQQQQYDEWNRFCSATEERFSANGAQLEMARKACDVYVQKGFY